jgi:hypothetical protein
MKKIYISAGFTNYVLSESELGNKRKEFGSYDEMLLYLKSDTELVRLRKRPLQIATRYMDSEEIKKLEKDLVAGGFRGIKEIISEEAPRFRDRNKD